ncbi:MAG: hypothetical protein JNK48_14800 [Bryobacterales bacterium]|nr:hypothetical protein [Bryobacterales bacterium]
MSNVTSVSSQPEKSNGWSMPTAAALALSVALAGGNAYLLVKTDRLENQMKELRAAFKTELVSVQQEVASRGSNYNKVTEELRKQIEDTGARSALAANAATRANSAAKKYSDDLAKKFAEQQKMVSDQHLTLAAQLGEMKDASSQAYAKVDGIASDVTNVKSEVASTKTELDKTIADLRSVRGDMGIQSGLIATNSKELAALRALGERDYIEFNLAKTKTPQRIGDIAVQLKKMDNRRNRYTIEVISNDKRVEKKDRTVNEPVQFYMAKARLPYELVVNEVRKDSIVGYLAAPKVRDLR